jgi:hypothetical protein
MKKAADKGDSQAMYNLGMLFENGTGVAQDYTTAREWYQKAVDKGDAGGMRAIGFLYESGHGVAQDYARAREWYQKAVDRGDAGGMRTIGFLTRAAMAWRRTTPRRANAADKGDSQAMYNLAALYENGSGVARTTPGRAIREAAGAGRYSEALQLQGTLAARREAAETKREGKPGKETAEALGDVAWYAILAREFPKALTAVDRAHKLLPDDLAIETNRAHANMFLGRGKEAEAVYLAHKGNRVSEQDNQLWESVIANDFGEFRKAGLAHPMMAEIEKKLGVSP